MADDEGSEDVNDFLKRIREMGERRDREDEERTRKLEEEILQGRKEREARRAERARSLSPTKDSSSNLGTPASLRSATSTPVREEAVKLPPELSESASGRLRPNIEPASPNDMSSLNDNTPREPLKSPSKLSTSSNSSPSTSISRAGTLSWQQRPTSRGSGGPQRRPLSMLAAENRTSNPPRASPEVTTSEIAPRSKAQIAQSLGSKDPTWFRQTQDRGLGSAAFRKNLSDDQSETSSTSGAMRLPGMSRESTVEAPDRSSQTSDTVRSTSPSRQGSVRGDSSSLNRQSNNTSVSSMGGIGSPLPMLSSQRFEPPSDSRSSQGSDLNPGIRPLAMSPSQGRISPERIERPVSPTKGLGGFVQSAMLKRSDSVNKRWSVQAGPGLKRGDSVASNRSGYDATKFAPPALGLSQGIGSNSASRENSPKPDSRPTSSHTRTPVENLMTEKPKPLQPSVSPVTRTEPRKDENPAESSASHENASSSMYATGDSKADDITSRTSPPASPSKRWSPNKASWLENAINKPDSPKPRLTAPPQPSWKADLNRSRQQYGSDGVGQNTSSKEVSTPSFMRSPPFGTSGKGLDNDEIPSSFSAGIALKARVNSSDNVLPEEAAVEKDKPSEYKSPTPATTPHDRASTPLLPIVESKSANKTSPIPSPPRPSSSIETKTKSPPPVKPKPHTPPKTDFRSNLRSRRVSGGKGSKDEPEFQSALGKLKRAQTKNYVAPDELKDNITRGKAGLAVTGGPKKNERKDEFKESLLKQKEAMKAGAVTGVPRKTSADIAPKVQEKPTPEAIAKRQGLSKLNSKSDESNVKLDIAVKPLNFSKGAARDVPTSNLQPNVPQPAPETVKESPVSMSVGNSFGSSLAGLLSRGPPPIASASKPATPLVDILAGAPEPSKHNPGILESGLGLTHMTKGRAKGPKRRLPTTASKGNEMGGVSSSKLEELTTGPAKMAEPELMTRGKPNLFTTQVSETRPLNSISNNPGRKTPTPLSPRKPSTSVAISPSLDKALSPSNTPASVETGNNPGLCSPDIKAKPAISKPALHSRKPSLPSSAVASNLSAKVLNDSSVQPSSVATSGLDTHRPEELNREKVGAFVKGAASTWERPTPNQQRRPKSPIKLPTWKDQESPTVAVDETEQKAIGLGIKSVKENPRSNAAKESRIMSPALKSPPPPGRKPADIASRNTSSAFSTVPLSPPTTPSNHQSEVSTFLQDFLGPSPAASSHINVDAQAALNSDPSTDGSEKIKTLRKQIWEVTGDGKSVPVPSQEEHILFEENLYLCTHVFGTLAGTRTTEVYLWCGDAVPTAQAEDAQLFARRVAKEQGGKLIMLKQGKETPNFFQALGGIVITRKGSSSRSGSAASYALCGRRHLGQIAFDEVSFSKVSLCSGFPYLLSARFGKLYLWKGTGSGADELGCARLIGMDLGLTGEIEEVDEGKETPEFWEVFPDSTKASTQLVGTKSEHWHLKSKSDKYNTRLFAVDVEPPQPKSNSGFAKWARRGSAPADENAPWTAQMGEIAPFVQDDLREGGIFVFDAFFELFIIIPRSPYPSTSPQRPSLSSQQNAKATTLRAAILFAQDYAILAASAQDRPFVPACRVITGTKGDVPEGVRMAFRKWDIRGGAERERCRIFDGVEMGRVLEEMGKGQD